MIEPVAATALILSILALIAYYLQPEQPQHQHHYYHQVRRSRVMADPQRCRRGGGVERGAEIRGRGEGEAYEQENEEGEGEDEGRGEVVIGVRKLGLIGRGVVGSRLGLEGGVKNEGDRRIGATATREYHGDRAEGVDVSTKDSDVYTAASLERGSPPIMRITAHDDNIASTILPIHDPELGIAPESCYYNTLDQQRRQRVRFDEALRMHSYGGSQYVGKVEDREL